MASRKTILLTLIIAVLMASSGLYGISLMSSGSGSHQQSSPVAGSHQSPVSKSSGTTNAAAKTPGSISRNINNYLFLPAKSRNFKIENGTVQPLYVDAPAPMGIGDFGIVNTSNGLVGENYYAQSFQADISVNNMTVYNLANDGPHSLTFQLNTVTANTTLFGKSAYTFWTQNVASYSTRTHQLSLEINIWNFSSPQAYLSNNAIYNSTGFAFHYPGVYIAIGPTFTLNYPFTLKLYTNLSELGGRNVVYFNYSIPSIGQSGTYDRVTFNSTYGMPPGYIAPFSYFRVSGTQLTPLGLLYDAEIMLGGPGGGSTTNVMDMNGTMQLMYIPAPTQVAKRPGPPPKIGPGNKGKKAPTPSYVNVPSAFDFGTDTGETSMGMAVAWNSNDQAILHQGPSILYGMWNVSPETHMEQFRGTVSPSNAFLFVSPGGTINYSEAGYTPLTASGSYDFWLPAGQYTAQILMSYYEPEMQTLSSHDTFTLTYDSLTGIYTPLFAMNNAQLANISYSGTGTQVDPYMLYNQQYYPISPVFASVNDFSFPQFEGVMLLNTNAYVEASQMPSFAISYEFPASSNLNNSNLPITNDLGYWLYNVTHFILWNSSQISGWYSSNAAGFPVASVILWNSSDNLIGMNTFEAETGSVLIYNGQDNVIWGNYFQNSLQLVQNPELDISANVWGEPAGVILFGSNNTVYNNYFTVEMPALSPDYNIYTGNFTIYMNAWNISEQTASTPHYDLGVLLGGSIVGGFYQGGNFWWNFNGVAPYTDGGNIGYGGDFAPLNTIDLQPVNTAMLGGNIPYLLTSSAFSGDLYNLGPVPDSTPVNVTLYLNMTNLSRLSAFVSSVNSPLSPDFHDYLNSTEFQRMYYPDASVINSIASNYRSQGFKVWSYSYSPLVLVLSGNAGMILKTFGVTEFDFAFGSTFLQYPTIFMSNAQNPYIPVQMETSIVHVYGMSYSTDALLMAGPHSGSTLTDLQAAPLNSLNGSTGLLTPTNLANYYGVTELHNMGYSGQGMKIGILGVGESPNISTISEFWNYYGIHRPTVNFINLTSNGLNPYPEGVEADLDVEWSGAMAPDATIYDVMQPFNITGIGDNAVNIELYYFLNTIEPQVISGSWAEFQFHHDSGFAQIYNLIGMQAVAEGITIFLGSSDSHLTYYQTVMTSQYIVSVGGIDPIMNSTGVITGEYGWYQPEFSFYGGAVGSGGGNSFFYPRPLYQTIGRIVVPDRFTMRAQPDISMPASKMVFAANGFFGVAGGTSFATPISAGIFADIGQYLYQSGSSTTQYMGWIQPVLYELGYGTAYGLPAYHMVQYSQPYPGETTSNFLGTGWNDFAGIGSLSSYNLSIDMGNYFLSYY
jgi:thermopsin